MDRKEKLKELLRKLHSEDDTEKLKKEAASLLKEIDAKTLSLAEQELIQEGMSVDEIRKLCQVHLGVLKEQLEEEKPQLEPEHPISVLMEEHRIILDNLQNLAKIVERAQKEESFDTLKQELEDLKKIAHLLVEAEKHHQREEEALFPRLEEIGVTGPPRIMRMEHTELRAQKKALKTLSDEIDRYSYAEFAKRLQELGGYLVTHLTDHIYKEDTILYPTAIQSLEEGVWQRVKEDFDKIGYCCFTPQQNAC